MRLANLLLLLSLAAPLPAQEAPAREDPRELLLRIRARVMETVNRLPKYMCTQTIDRVRNEPAPTFRPPPCDALLRFKNAGTLKVHPVESDRLRFDVGIAGTREIYSLAGENRFDDRGLLDMVQGAISTGSFSSLLRMIFEIDSSRLLMQPAASFSFDRPWRAQASFFYLGEKTSDGRALVEFGFRIPVEESHYTFRNSGNKPVITAYDGTFLADSATLDLARLTVQTSEIPIETGVCQATTALDYRRFHLNHADFLLPVETRLQVIGSRGTENHNRTVYSGCREFLGESTVKFEPPPDDLSPQSSKASSAPLLVVPAGFPFTLVLTQDIDTSTAAAGDPVTAKLAGAIREGSRVFVPEGAAVRGRIVRIERFYVPYSYWTIVIKLETVEAGGTAVPLPAIVDRTLPSKAVGKFKPRGLDLGTMRDVEDSGFAVLQLSGNNPIVKKGLKTAWVTVPPKPAR